MDYQAAIEWLYKQLPSFERSGSTDYKPGLETNLALSAMCGNPHKKFPTIHIAGTNGKGSTASTLAAILQSAGLRTGLYTSPHIFDFRERIRVDGGMVSKEFVSDFVSRFAASDAAASTALAHKPTFFELTTVMAFEYFAEQNVDIAVIETGLGGRLDSTNIITPIVSVITNVSLDHTDLLGDTLEKIATEKAGIIKPGVPVVVGAVANDGVKRVFEQAAEKCGAPLVHAWAEESIRGNVPQSALCGPWQAENSATTLATVDVLRKSGLAISPEAVERGFSLVDKLTGLRGRWTKVSDIPAETVVDTGHNPGAWQHIAPALAAHAGHKYVILGFVADKDTNTIAAMLPKGEGDFTYIATQPHSSRALSATALADKLTEHGISAEVTEDVNAALESARKRAKRGDLIFIGGSNYLLSELIL